MQIHVINLKDAVERRRSITKQLDQLGLEFEIFDAVKGAGLSEEELSAKIDMREVEKYPNWLTKGMLGAALSHMGVYRKIIQSEIEWHLILEDDVLLKPDIRKVLSHIESNPGLYKNHLVLLYVISVFGNIELEASAIGQMPEYNIHRIITRSVAGAGAYVIHRDTARAFVDKNPKLKVAPDDWKFFLDQGVFSQMDCVYPFAAQPGFFESTIGYVQPGSLKYKVKHFVEDYKVPVLYYFIKKRRKKIWERTSKIFFKK